jgi:ABC-type lipoprotein release transport system permease subunit
MEKKSSNAGQAALEYLLLLGMVIGIMTLVMSSDVMRGFTDLEDGVMRDISESMRFSYRHGLSGRTPENYPDSYNSSDHKTYKATDTRFFAPRDAYPNN